MLLRLFEKLKKIAWFLPGFLLWAAFPPMAEMTDALFALAPLMWLTRKGNRKESAKRWFQSGLFYWVATLSWMPAIVKNDGPWPLVVLGWAALAAYCSLYFAAYGYLSAKYWNWAGSEMSSTRSLAVKRMFGILVAEPVLWCGLELVRSRLFGGFAWNQLGVVSVNGGFGAPAALGGVYLLSAVIILINGTIAGIAERVLVNFRRKQVTAVSRWRSLETLLAFAAVLGIYAAAARWGNLATRSENYLKVALVQRNFPCCFKGPEENAREIYEKLTGNVAALDPDIVLLPESAMCEFGAVDHQGAVNFAEWLSGKCNGASVLAGGTRFGDGRIYNSAALYDGGLQIYDKVHLVPFGEFIPGDKLIPWLQKFAPVGSCTPGEERLLKLKEHPFGVAICFEDTDSALMRQYAAMGAEFLAFITNDSWFSDSVEAEAHAWQAVARAIETGLPVLRVGNSGVTGTISPAGKASWLCDAAGRPLVDKRAVMFDRVALPASAAKMTPYVLYGDIPLASMFALLTVGVFLVKYRA